MAKKLFCILYAFFICVFLFSGCSSAQPPNESIITDFSAKFDSHYQESEYKGTIVTNRQGVTTISITYPQTVEGLVFTYHNSELVFSQVELICSADEAYLPQNSLPSMIKSIFDGIKSGDTTIISCKDNTKELSLNTPSGTALLTVTDDMLTKAEIKPIDFSIEFSSIKALE